MKKERKLAEPESEVANRRVRRIEVFNVQRDFFHVFRHILIALISKF